MVKEACGKTEKSVVVLEGGNCKKESLIAKREQTVKIKQRNP